MIAAPLIAGNDIRHMASNSADILLNKEVIAVDQDALGAGGQRVSSSGDIEIWKKRLLSGDLAVAIFNHSSQEMRAVVPWNLLGIDKNCTIRDLWTHTDIGVASEVTSEPVAAHGVIMLRVRKPA
jgi:alpha-galactosidase